MIRLLVLLCLVLAGGCRESNRSKQSDSLLRQQREERAGLHRDAEVFTGSVDDEGTPLCKQGALCFEQWFTLYRDAMCTCTDRACADELEADFDAMGQALGKLEDMTREIEARIEKIALAYIRCNVDAGLAAIPEGNDVPRPIVMQKVRRIPPGPAPDGKPTCATPHDQSTCMHEWAYYYRTAMCACADRTCGEPLYQEMKTWLAKTSTADYQNVLQLGGLSTCIADVLATDPNAPPLTATAPPTCTEGVDCFVEWQAHWMARTCACRDARDAACAKTSMDAMLEWTATSRDRIAPGGAPSRLLMQQLMELSKQTTRCMTQAMMYAADDERRAKRGPPTRKVRGTRIGPKPAAPPTCTVTGDTATCLLTWFAYQRDEMCACPDRACADARDIAWTEWFIHSGLNGPALAPEDPETKRMTELQSAYARCRDDAEMTAPGVEP